MEIEELTEELKRDAQRLKEEKIELIDFDKLESNLRIASNKLKHMKEREELSDKILGDFKDEIKRLAISLSRLKGENAACGLVEKYLSSRNTGYEELCLLKKNLQEEFHQSFPSSPVSRSFYPFAVERKAKDRMEEFKIE